MWLSGLCKSVQPNFSYKPRAVVVTNVKFRNVPTTLGNDWPLRSPGNARAEQFFFAR